MTRSLGLKVSSSPKIFSGEKFLPQGSLEGVSQGICDPINNSSTHIGLNYRRTKLFVGHISPLFSPIGRVTIQKSVKKKIPQSISLQEY